MEERMEERAKIKQEEIGRIEDEMRRDRIEWKERDRKMNHHMEENSII